MLKVFRENIKYLSWILWLVIIVFVLFVFVDFGSVVGGLGSPGAAAATVGDETITYAQYQRAYTNLEARYRETFGEQFSPELARQLGLERQALEQLVNQTVLALEARRLGLEVGNDELRRTILDIPGFTDPKGRFIDTGTYERAVRSMRYSTVEEFEHDLREQILIERLYQMLTDSIYLSEAQVERAYRDQIEKASIRYLLLPETALRGDVVASDDELAAYLAAHRDELRLPERRKVAYLLVDTGLLRNQVELTDDEVRAYYDEHPDEFEQEEQVRARHILLRAGEERSQEQAEAELAALRRRIEGGESFADVARQASEDPGSAARGGDLGYFGRGRMTPEFEQAAFAAAPGALVGPVVTPFGVHLLEVTDRRPAGLAPFAEVEARIRNRMISDRVQQLAETTAQEVAQSLGSTEKPATGGPLTADRLRAAAEGRPGVTFNETEPFGRDGLVPAIGRSPEFTEAAFSTALGEVSEPVRVPRGYALVAPLEVLEPRDPELAEVEDSVRQAAERELRQQAAMDRLAAARADLAAGAKTLDQVAAELGATVEDSGAFGAAGPVRGLGLVPQISEAALSMSEGEVGGPFGISRGAVLFEVSGRTRYDPTAFEAAAETTRAQLENEELGRLLVALLQQRKAELGVRYDRQLTESLNQAAGAGAGA